MARNGPYECVSIFLLQSLPSAFGSAFSSFLRCFSPLLSPKQDQHSHQSNQFHSTWTHCSTVADFTLHYSPTSPHYHILQYPNAHMHIGGQAKTNVETLTKKSKAKTNRSPEIKTSGERWMESNGRKWKKSKAAIFCILTVQMNLYVSNHWGLHCKCYN